LVGRGEPAVGVGGGAVQQELRALELERHLGELALQPLELAQRPAALPARRDMLARTAEGVAAERERARRVADPLDVEAGDLLLETARPEQDVLGGNAAVVEMPLPPFLAAH